MQNVLASPAGRIFVVVALLCAYANAACSGASYSSVARSIDAGGASVKSASYSFNGSGLGEFGAAADAVATSSAYKMKAGYVGELYDLVALAITAPPSNTINESTSKQLAAAPLADDGTLTAALDPTTVSWSIVSGPISSLTSSGVATASIVYQNTLATVSGAAQGRSGQLNLTVNNVNTDDFGAYAGDGVDDSWQVQYFGPPPNANAAPNADPDGDGETNLFEFTAGLLPTNAASRFTLTILPVAGQPSQTKLVLAPIVAGRTYTVQSSATLGSAASWTALTGSSQTDNGAQRTVIDFNASPAPKFYRVQITKP